MRTGDKEFNVNNKGNIQAAGSGTSWCDLTSYIFHELQSASGQKTCGIATLVLSDATAEEKGTLGRTGWVGKRSCFYKSSFYLLHEREHSEMHASILALIPCKSLRVHTPRHQLSMIPRKNEMENKPFNRIYARGSHCLNLYNKFIAHK